MILFSVLPQMIKINIKRKKPLRHLKTNFVIRLSCSPTVPKDKETLFTHCGLLYYYNYLEEYNVYSKLLHLLIKAPVFFLLFFHPSLCDIILISCIFSFFFSSSLEAACVVFVAFHLICRSHIPGLTHILQPLGERERMNSSRFL